MPAAAAPARAGRGAAAPAPPVPAIPFVAAAHEHTEPAFDVSVTPGAAAVNLGPFDVPAYGFARHIFLEVTSSGGALGTGALSADYPYNLFGSIALNDVNGAPIFGPIDGYAALWTNIIGGYEFQSDPRRSPAYVATINSAFDLRIPIEISHHDGFGALANQNAAASYKVALTVNPLATILATVGTATAPTFRVRGYLEAWSLPNQTDVAGRGQQQFPPVHGTTQFWSQNIKAVSVGANTVPFVRVGNLIRTIVLIGRTAAGARSDTVLPDPATIAWDARSLYNDTLQYRIQKFFERQNNMLARDAGVLAYQFNHSNRNAVGDDSPTLWLPTVQSTRLELGGTWAAAGNVQILTNDVAPAEVIPAERFVETSQTGFHPQMGVSNASAQ